MNMNRTLTDKVLSTFNNPVYNTFTAKQAAARFGVTETSVRGAVKKLRVAGFPIYRNKKNFEGREIAVYRLGTPSKSYKKALRNGDNAGILKALG